MCVKDNGFSAHRSQLADVSMHSMHSPCIKLGLGLSFSHILVKFTKISKFACASRSTYSWVLQYINVIDRRNAHYAEVLNLVWYPDRILLSLVRPYLACRGRYTYSTGILRKLQYITVPMGNVKKWTLELRWNCDNAGGSTWAPPSSTVWPCQHQ